MQNLEEQTELLLNLREEFFKGATAEQWCHDHGEYFFFDERPRQRLIGVLRAEHLEPDLSRGDGGRLVALAEEIDDELDARIEAFYDEMPDYNQRLVAAAEGGMCIPPGSMSPCGMAAGFRGR